MNSPPAFLRQVPLARADGRDTLATMRRVLQGAGLAIGLVALIAWIAGGRNLGWTRTQEPVKTLDEITGIEGITWQPVFRPGIDFLALAAAGGAAAWGAAWLWKRK